MQVQCSNNWVIRRLICAFNVSNYINKRLNEIVDINQSIGRFITYVEGADFAHLNEKSHVGRQFGFQSRF